MSIHKGIPILPNNLSTFCKKWDWFKAKFGKEHYIIEFHGQRDFKTVIRDHFKNTSVKGVYVIFDAKSNSVIYIGKGGTISQGGNYKKQDVKDRLTNTRKGKNANSVFDGYLKTYGNIRIEYISLSLCFSPSLVEVYLLQAFLNEKGNLPPENLAL